MDFFIRAGESGERNAATGSSASSPGATRHTESDRLTYDALQLAAVLVTCAGCGRDFYMTHPKERCVECREALK